MFHDEKEIQKEISEEENNVPLERKPDYFLKLNLLGDSRVGKSALLGRFFNKTYKYTDGRDYDPTIAVEFGLSSIDIGDERNLILQIWDVSGQEKYRSLASGFEKGSNAGIAVFDLTSQESFDHIPAWVENYRKGPSRRPTSKEASVILVGTKCDEEAEVTPKQIEELKKELSIEHYIPTSAKTGENVDEVFRIAAQVGLKDVKEDHEEMMEMARQIKSPQEILRERVISDLKHYMETIEKYPRHGNEKEKEAKINFGHGLHSFFWFYSKKSQALNRRANYYLAEKLLQELNAGKSLKETFNDAYVKKLRADIVFYKGISCKKRYRDRGINSSTLNGIIQRGRKPR